MLFRSYWKKKLDKVEPLNLPTDNARPLIQSNNGKLIRYELDKKLSDKIQNLSLEYGSSMFMTLLAVFKILIYKYTGQEDISIGSPVANRMNKEIEPLMGFFINVLVLRSSIHNDLYFTEFLSQVKENALKAYENQEIPFEKIVKEVVDKIDTSRNPLFDILFSLHNVPENEIINLGDVTLEVEPHIHETSQFDLNVNITETTKGLILDIEYSSDLFKEKTIERMLNHYTELLISIVSNPNQRIRDLSILTIDEKNRFFFEINNTNVKYPYRETV